MRKCSDDFGVRLTAIVITLLFCSPLFAGSDLSLGSSARSYPLSGTVDIDGGYDFLLWGSSSGGSPKYGYLRPHLDGSTTISYNSLGASVDFFPISFLGARAGGEGIQNDADYKAYDCLSYICRGRFYRTYVQADLTLGAGAFFAQGRWRREHWARQTQSLTPFIEPTSGLALAGQGDSQTVYRGMIGAKVSLNWSVAAVLVYGQNDSNNGISRFPFALIRYTAGAFSAGLGGGAFSSSLKTQEGSALVFLRWDIKPSLALN